MILSTGGQLRLDDALAVGEAAPSDSARSLKQDLEQMERQRILQALEACRWKIKGEGNAADRLGLEPSTLRSRIKRLGIVRP